METSAFVSSFLPSALVRPSPSGPPLARPRASPRRAPSHGAVIMSSDKPGGEKPNIVRKVAAAALAALLALPFPTDSIAATPGRGFGSSSSNSSQLVAASSGGRIGGSSFRRSAPVRPSGGGYRGGYRGGYGGGGYGYGGGLFSPLVPVMPYYFSPFSAPVVVGGGGGGIVSALVVAGAAAVLLRGVAFRESTGEDEYGSATRDVAVVKLKVALLASATRVRNALDALARGGDTSTPSGLARVLGDAAVSLLRSSDYWVSAATDLTVAGGGEAERTFNETAVRERSRLAETLSNVSGERRSSPEVEPSGAAPEEFVVVTLLVAADASIARKLPRRIRTPQDVFAILNALGGISGDQMQGLEVLWAPQQRGDSLTRAEMLLDHPELREL